MPEKQPAKKPAARKPAATTPAAGRRGARSTAKKTAVTAGKKRADAVAKKAADAAAKGPRLSSAKAQLRNSMILARHAQGLSWEDIAKEAGISSRSCQRIAEDARKVASPIDQTPMQILEDLARGFSRSIADYEGLAFAWADTNQAAALGAKKAADETRVRLAALMANVGKLPENLGQFRTELEMEQLVEAMGNFLMGVRDGAYELEEAEAFLREIVGRPQITAGDA